MSKTYTWLAVESFEKTEAAKEAWAAAYSYRCKLWSDWNQVYWVENKDRLTIREAEKAVEKAIREDGDLENLYHAARVAQNAANVARNAALKAKKGQAV